MLASVPHETTTVPLGTPKTAYFCFLPVAVSTVVILRFFAGFVLKSASFDTAGPAISCFVFLSKRYHSLAPLSLTSACWPESSE